MRYFLALPLSVLLIIQSSADAMEWSKWFKFETVKSLYDYYFPNSEPSDEKVAQKETDSALIRRLDEFSDQELKLVPFYFDQAFSTKERIRERDAAHSSWIRRFIHVSQIPQKTVKIIKTLSEDQIHIGLAYLSAIDQGTAVSKREYPAYFDRIEKYAQRFIDSAGSVEKATHAPGWTDESEGRGMRPISGSHLQDPSSPRLQRHAVISLMLGEFRRSLHPEKHVKVDEHFYKLNQASRPGLIAKMKAGNKEIRNKEFGAVITYEMAVQIEFFPKRIKTEKESFKDGFIQGEGILTTDGWVTEYSFKSGKIAYLIKYLDYKQEPEEERYLVSDVIPIGVVNEQYSAELTLDEAEKLILEFAKSAK